VGFAKRLRRKARSAGSEGSRKKTRFRVYTVKMTCQNSRLDARNAAANSNCKKREEAKRLTRLLKQVIIPPLHRLRLVATERQQLFNNKQPISVGV
jgi:hypothetical protein